MTTENTIAPRLLKFTRPQLKQAFFDNLSIKDPMIKTHVVGFLDDFIHKNDLPIKDEMMDSIRVNDLFEKGDYMPLVKLGDAYMFLLGVFPEHLSEKRRYSMGIKFYVEKGKDSYNYAVGLSYTEKDKPIATGIISKLADNFIPYSLAIIEMRRRFKNSEVVLDQAVCKELEAIGYRPDFRNFLVIAGSGDYNAKEKHIVDDGHLRRIK
jgi:hypothetical protein